MGKSRQRKSLGEMPMTGPTRSSLTLYMRKSLAKGLQRLQLRNAFRPQTIKELIRAFNDARDRDNSSVGVIIASN
ncbi:1,4-dihydroxy-2-naphthoyl-CoA synthase, peroxisomal [Hevea brasiliensis]|uniref:1,4-dihydroxy-2-naphthoyl-CoA synthase, peroxisomal n=1 Tax=Hevea brasiliensis TaxID=3981 RepID=UPI0025E6CDFA|nr:1,4-dihydroxy-2-naphthoyl-CoA synthase, peroxisomal [Hevea brasiliensis]